MTNLWCVTLCPQSRYCAVSFMYMCPKKKNPHPSLCLNSFMCPESLFPPPPSLHDVIYDEPLARSSFLTALLVVSCSFRFSSRISSIFSSSSVIRAALCSTYDKQDRFEICFKYCTMDG